MEVRNMIVAAIIEEFEKEENKDLFNACADELDQICGLLADDRYYRMAELPEVVGAVSTLDLLQMAFFGHDKECWETDSYGNCIYGRFNPNREYFKFDGYGNLVSADYIDYSDFLNDDFVESLLEYRDGLYTLDDDQLAEVNRLLDQLEKED